MSKSSITLGGIRDVDLGFRVLEESSAPMLAPTRDMTLVIPGRNGQYDYGADLEGLSFTYKCAFVSDGTNYVVPSATGLQQRVRQLAKHLCDSRGKPRSMKLVRSWEPDKYYIVRYAGSSPIDRIMYSSVGIFTLPLMAFDPHAYSQLENVLELNITESPQTVPIDTGGTVRAEPVIELTNQGTDTIHHFVIVNEYRVE